MKEIEEEDEVPGPPVLPPQIIVPAEAAGMRLDTWLSRLPDTPSRNRVQQLVKDGLVQIDGVLPKASHTLEGGETVDVQWPPPDDDWPFPEDIPIDVVYEDDDLVVVNKQANMIVHPSAGNPDGTLVNGLLFKYPALPGINGVRRPGIVHRLDRDTTGLLVVARTDRAMSSLAKQLAARTMHRTYLGLVIGDPKWDQITVDAAVGRDPINRLRRAIDGGFARPARSHFKVLRRTGQFTLIQCKLETGRTHQIRVHCRHLGHPIVCDTIYDGALHRCLEKLVPSQHDIKRAMSHFDRPWLHAYQLDFHHPALSRHMEFQVPPPAQSMDVIQAVFGSALPEFIGARGVKMADATAAEPVA